MASPAEESPDVLRIERTYNAPPEDVFDAWTSVEVLRRWFHAGPDWETPHAEVDLRVGGRIRIVMRNPDQGVDHGAEGEYIEIDPPRRLLFNWRFDRLAGTPDQLIELEFIDHGDSTTTVVMTNSRIPDAERENQRHGWGLCFDNLDVALPAP